LPSEVTPTTVTCERAELSEILLNMGTRSLRAHR
jgi:hypothetical protein